VIETFAAAAAAASQYLLYFTNLYQFQQISVNGAKKMYPVVTVILAYFARN